MLRALDPHGEPAAPAGRGGHREPDLDPTSGKEDNMTQTTARGFGVVFLLVGVLGLSRPRSRWRPRILLGLFPVNVLHNLVHLSLRRWGLLAGRISAGRPPTAGSRGWRTSCWRCWGSYADRVRSGSLGGHDVWLHALIGADSDGGRRIRQPEHLVQALTERGSAGGAPPKPAGAVRPIESWAGRASRARIRPANIRQTPDGSGRKARGRDQSTGRPEEHAAPPAPVRLGGGVRDGIPPLEAPPGPAVANGRVRSCSSSHR